MMVNGFLITMIMAGLSGCTAGSTTDTLPIKSTPCPQPPANSNIYKATPAPAKWVDEIFTHVYPSYATLPVPNPINEQLFQEARYAAFQRLVTETKRWSTSQRVKLDNSSEVQIIVTFVSPELFQAVFLNEIINHHIFTSDFPALLQKVLNSIGDRGELIFLVTVIKLRNESINLTPHVIDIPVRDMILNNSEDLPILPNHDDHNLDQPIDPSTETAFGYLAYPFTTQINNECKWILDPKYNTTIVITGSKISVDGVEDKSKYTWAIPYMPLMDMITSSDQPMFGLPSGYNANEALILATPPPLALNPNGKIADDYWKEFAKFVLDEITLGDY
jgi:hypothetical protein